MTIDLTVYTDRRRRVIERVRKQGIIVPTFAQMKDPRLVPEPIKQHLREIGLWELNPLNLFRITWKNDPVEEGGGFGSVNYIELPSELTGVKARIFALVGKWFPTGAHKVGAAFGSLIPHLVTGQFDPTSQKAVWPSTGNYCRGGAYDSNLLGCESIAILPEGMSQERFDWLANITGETIKTPGSESNVKEIFDKCWELRRSGRDLMIFDQFTEFGNYLWHYDVTGHALEELLEHELSAEEEYRGVVISSGSGGTISCGDYLKQIYPGSKIGAAEALQCPTLLENGFGAHRIEGIGDKMVSWIHNVKNTDIVLDIDDNAVVSLARLFNEPSGRDFLVQRQVPEEAVRNLHLLGFSGISNLLATIKFAKYYELDAHDVVLTVLTDSMELYQSRLQEMREEHGEYSQTEAAKDYEHWLIGADTEHTLELRYTDRRRIHNLKYFTWIEQQGEDVEELRAQWYDRRYWTGIQQQIANIDMLIQEFNDEAGILKTYG